MKRYDFDEGYRYESTGGEYVLYEDAKELEAENDIIRRDFRAAVAIQVKQRTKALEDMLRELMQLAIRSCSEVESAMSVSDISHSYYMELENRLNETKIYVGRIERLLNKTS